MRAVLSTICTRCIQNEKVDARTEGNPGPRTSDGSPGLRTRDVVRDSAGQELEVFLVGLKISHCILWELIGCFR